MARVVKTTTSGKGNPRAYLSNTPPLGLYKVPDQKTSCDALLLLEDFSRRGLEAWMFVMIVVVGEERSCLGKLQFNLFGYLGLCKLNPRAVLSPDSRDAYFLPVRIRGIDTESSITTRTRRRWRSWPLRIHQMRGGWLGRELFRSNDNLNDLIPHGDRSALAGRDDIRGSEDIHTGEGSCVTTLYVQQRGSGIAHKIQTGRMTDPPASSLLILRTPHRPATSHFRYALLHVLIL